MPFFIAVSYILSFIGRLFSFGSGPKYGGHYNLQKRRRFWLASDAEAEAKERELRHQAPAEALTWHDAHQKWLNAHLGKRSPGHLSATETTLRQWIEAFGIKSTIEDTDLAKFVDWVESTGKGTKGRGAQIKHAHLLAIARWCRKRGLIESIPFEHAPKPEAALEKRRPASVEEFTRIAAALPPQMHGLWMMLGLTGMRISAACTLQESDIGDKFFTVTTKGNKRVEYPITPEIREVIEETRRWKFDKAFTPPTLFCSHRGRPWKHYTFSEQLRRYTNGVHITPHQIRHMAGTIMAENNLSADIIQAGLGHEHRVSSEPYIDQTAKMRAKALQTIARNLSCKCKKSQKVNDSEGQRKIIKINERLEGVCPCCGVKLLVEK